MYQKRGGFTVIEVLILIIIIGVLVLAIIPRMRTLQYRARDIARQGDLIQLNTALQSYRAQNQTYPIISGAIQTTLSDLMPVHIRSLPSDPSNRIATTNGAQSATGSYLYLPIENNQGYVLMAVNESGKGNRISNANSSSLTGSQPGFISHTTLIKDLSLNICLSTAAGPISRDNRHCTANKNNYESKYIIFSN